MQNSKLSRCFVQILGGALRIGLIVPCLGWTQQPDADTAMLVATWKYFPHSNYDKWLKPYTDAGMKIIVYPWVGSGSLIVPDYELATYNICHFVGEGKTAGAVGMDNTVWNDNGETLYGLNWYSIVYGAAAS